MPATSDADRQRLGPAALGALGIVFGDIGTSPLYAFKEAIGAAGATDGTPFAAADTLGLLSLIIWLLILVISVKYAVLILRADNYGEGGILALLTLCSSKDAKPTRWKQAIVFVGLVGAALLYGDGAITPAISVLSAVEGLKVDAPKLSSAILPITTIILIGLFLIQSRGTAFVGRIFGPVMLAWFLVIGVLGTIAIVRHPAVLAAFSPTYAIFYLLGAGHHILPVIGAVFLAVTGGEALYADMGHFGRRPMRLAWFALVLPCLILNYLGQGALVLTSPDSIENPFYGLAPASMHYVLVVFATLATVIASQAIISGAFSLTHQAIQLGFLPRMKVVHTASDERGQIYIPVVNWLLALTTLAATIGFGSSSALAGAYGVAVSLLMAITTILASVIALRWRYNLALVLIVNGAFLLIDFAFFGANTLKIADGGWFPLLVAGLVAFIMMTWRRGQTVSRTIRDELRPTVQDFVAGMKAHPPLRTPGTGIFLSNVRDVVPLHMAHHLKHNGVLHERVFLVCAVTDRYPRISAEKRVEVLDPVCGIGRLHLHFGFMELPDVPRALAYGVEQGQIDPIDLDAATYYLGRETIIPLRIPHTMMLWREHLYAFMTRNAERSGAYFSVPSRQVVEIGVEIEI
jgi:KUP system potassium uptake protein